MLDGFSIAGLVGFSIAGLVGISRTVLDGFNRAGLVGFSGAGLTERLKSRFQVFLTPFSRKGLAAVRRNLALLRVILVDRTRGDSFGFSWRRTERLRNLLRFGRFFRFSQFLKMIIVFTTVSLISSNTFLNAKTIKKCNPYLPFLTENRYKISVFN